MLRPGGSSVLTNDWFCCSAADIHSLVLLAKPECNPACVLRNKTKIYRKCVSKAKRSDQLRNALTTPTQEFIFIKFMFIKQLLHNEFIPVQAEVTTGQETCRDKFPVRVSELANSTCNYVTDL